MDFLLFALEEAQGSNLFSFEHGTVASLIFTILFSATASFFLAYNGYEELRSSPRANIQNLIRARFDVTQMTETEKSRKETFQASVVFAILFFIVCNALVYVPVRILFNITYELLCYLGRL